MKRDFRLCLIGLVGCLVFAAVWNLVAAPGTALAKGKPGGDSPPEEPAPIDDKSVIRFCVNFRNAQFDRIKSDGIVSTHIGYQYCDDEDDFNSGSNRKGKVLMFTDSHVETDFDRRMQLDFRNLINTDGLPIPADDVPVRPNGSLFDSVDVDIRFKKQNAPQFLGQMALDSSDSAWVQVIFYDINGTMWRLVYETEQDGIDGEITRTDGFTWLIEAEVALLSKDGSPNTLRNIPGVFMPFAFECVDKRWVLYDEQLP